MGSRLVLTVSGAGNAAASAAWDATVQEMSAADLALSRFRASSDLSRLNRDAGSGTARTIGRRLRTMLLLARRAQRMTDGRFDPRVIGILEGLGEHAGVWLPEVATSPPATNAEWLVAHGRSTFSIATPLDSGGIGKGLGLRWAREAAQRAAPACGLLIEAGGDVVVSGCAPDGGSWTIGIEDPGGGPEPMATIALRGGAVATSATAVRHWTSPRGESVHHLIDPRTGQPAATGLLSVTLAMADPAWAEVWTKALFLAGAGGIGPEARARGLAAWWIEEDGSIHMTPAGRMLTTWQR
jgi:thiamine biosynthesis lipoprotein